MLSLSLLTITGLISIACLIVGVGLFLFRGNKNLLDRLAIPTFLILSLGFLAASIYTTVYTIEQPNTYVDIAKEHLDDADCGNAWTGWFAIGSGLQNPCDKGCYRGATLTQEVKMAHFPPWPIMRRQIQCWVRSPQPNIAAITNPDSAGN